MNNFLFELTTFSRIFQFCPKIRNQRSEKPLGIMFYQNRNIFFVAWGTNILNFHAT